MKHTVDFFVAGEPKAQPRPRAFSRGGKAMMYDPGTSGWWKSQVAAAAKDSKLPLNRGPLTGPVVLSLVFHLKRPKKYDTKRLEGWCVPCTVKPDLDNLAKAVLDALTVVGVWRDDSQVQQLNVEKWYGCKHHTMGCQVVVSWEEDDE